VRKAADASLFATAYDPKSACDYVCEGLPEQGDSSWSKKDAAFYAPQLSGNSHDLNILTIPLCDA
jgi:hypothetical protein